jgi:hypothetical protein
MDGHDIFETLCLNAVCNFTCRHFHIDYYLVLYLIIVPLQRNHARKLPTFQHSETDSRTRQVALLHRKLAMRMSRLDWSQLLETLMTTKDQFKTLAIMSRDRAMRAQCKRSTGFQKRNSGEPKRASGSN